MLINQKCYKSTSLHRSKKFTFTFLRSFLVEIEVTLMITLMFTLLRKILQFFQCSMILFFFQIYNPWKGDIMLLILKILKIHWYDSNVNILITETFANRKFHKSLQTRVLQIFLLGFRTLRIIKFKSFINI